MPTSMPAVLVMFTVALPLVVLPMVETTGNDGWSVPLERGPELVTVKRWISSTPLRNVSSAFGPERERH